MGWQIKTKDGNVYGPLDSETLRKWIQEKRILPEDYVWDEDKKNWVDITSISELKSLFKPGEQIEHKQEISEVKIPQEKSPEDFLHDDKNILTYQLIADAWRAMLAKGIWSIIGAIFLMGIVLMIGVGITVVILKNSQNPLIDQLIEQLVLIIILAPLILGWAAYSLKVIRRETVNASSIFEGFKGKYIGQAIVAIFLMSLLPNLAGLISFGIWGVYLQLSYIMSYFFIFDENRGPWESMKASYDITKGYKWRIMAVWTACWILGMLCLGIGLIVTMPLANIAIASLYYRLRTRRISEQHLQTSVAEYTIVLITFLVIIALTVTIAFVIFGKHLPFLSPQIEQIIKDVLLKEQLKR